MPTNYLTQFATSGTANLPVESTWQNLTERATGFQTGLARSAYFNRLFAQGANAAYVIGQMVVNYASADADLDGAALYANFKTALNSYIGGSFLPLSGGLMSGSIRRSGKAVQGTGTADYILFAGGTGTGDGAYVYIYAKEHATYPGQVRIAAYDGANSNIVTIRPDGAVLTGNKNFEVVSESSVADSGYIRFASGLQIVWEQLGSVSGGKSVTFAKAFSQTPVIAFSSSNATYPNITALNKTSMTVTSSNSGYARYIAIGAWS